MMVISWGPAYEVMTSYKKLNLFAHYWQTTSKWPQTMTSNQQEVFRVLSALEKLTSSFYSMIRLEMQLALSLEPMKSIDMP